MKKVLKLIVLVAVISALTLVAFAASTEVEAIPDESGAAQLTEIVAEVPADLEVEVVPPTENAANEAAAAAADAEPIILDSFDINVTKAATGEEVHEGLTVTITLNVGAQYAGYTLKLYETSDGATRVFATAIVPADGIVVIAIDSFSTFTPVLVKPAEVIAPAPGPVSPQTMQTVLPIALAILAVAAIAVAVVAKKRSFN